jgi:thiamine-monophosphate kinase
VDEFAFIRERLAPLSRGLPGARMLTDDAATIAPPDGHELVVTADVLVGGVHFRQDDPLDLVAGKALRVNLSDLAAKGAEPLAYLLSIVWPRGLPVEAKSKFVDGLARDQARFGIALLGGDTTAAADHFVVSVIAMGAAPTGSFVPRSGARPGDLVFVTGEIGDAGLEIAASADERHILPPALLGMMASRYLTPEPRTACAQALRGRATAALDVSDGLVADAGHIAETSGVRLAIEAEKIPLSHAGRAWLSLQGDRNAGLATLATGGDDYEILFCGPPDAGEAVARESGVSVTAIGRVEAGEGVVLLNKAGVEIPLVKRGYTHF